ncbi:MAG TPA: tetratricopeptide repeat protein [Phycisphaerae bacterium]|jgi:tetratricopeptide (TPR) repeat protein|nr:tetratricopeptide repeat protein [Phycisphaerae bacterium]
MRIESASPIAPICPEDFLNSLQPSLAQGRLQEAIQAVRERWSCTQILGLLADKSADVRKVAALALALAGDKSAVGPLAVALHDPDGMVAQVAEHALWSIWFRLGKPRAVQLVKCGNTHMHHGNYECALEKFTHAIQEDPDFAEAYNQRAIAHYLSERFTESIADCRAVLARMPQHFGAMSELGHCYANLGQWREARQCYRLALAIYPRLEGIQGSLEQIDQMLRDNPML